MIRREKSHLVLLRSGVWPVALALMAGLVVPVHADDALTYAGSSTIGMSILYQGALKEFENKTGVRFSKVDTNAGSIRGLDLLLEGKTSISGYARQFPEEGRLKGLVPHLIGYDALGIWVNAANPITHLKKEQVKAIFTGTVTTWKAVGGPDAKIRLFTTNPNEQKATLSLIQETILHNLPVTEANTTYVAYSRDALLGVSQDENAICAASIGLIGTLNPQLRKKIRLVRLDGVLPDKKVIEKGGYLLSRPLYLVTKGSPTGKIKEFIEFMLSPKGQAIVAKNFVPVTQVP